LGILNKSYIVKSPCEIHIHIEDGQIQALHKSDPNAVSLDMHPNGQYLAPGSDVLKNKQSLKITLPVSLRTKLPYIFLNPTYHKDTGLEVIPGVIEGKWVDHVSLIVHTMVDTSIDRYIHIKPGDPIAYAWFPEKTTLKYNPNIKDRRTMRFFNKPVDFIPNKK